MPEADLPDFSEQYRSLVKEVFHIIVEQSRNQGENPAQRAAEYAALGKPDFVLAFLIDADLPNADKREILAAAFEHRAELSEQMAQTLDVEHHRPFPLISLEARRDRTAARNVRQGKMIRLNARAPRPLSMQ